MTASEIGKFKLVISVSAALMLILTAACAIALFWYIPILRESLIFGAALVGGFAALYTGYYSVHLQRLAIDRDIMHRSVELINRVTGVELSNVRFFALENLDYNSIAPEDAYEKVTGNKETLAAVKTVLNHFEDASINIQKGYVDEATVYMALDFLVPHIWKTFEPYIKENRKISGNTEAWIELEKLAASWSSKKFISTGGITKKDA
ncbi:MAG: DUF4760 domain-containing protein [Sedimenticola sp.]